MSTHQARWAAALAVAATVGCGGRWSDADTKSASDALRAQIMIEKMLTDLGDAEVPAGRVRALERMAYCSTASLMFRHDALEADAGEIQCQP